MAADLVGSTAFKSDKSNQHYETSAARPKWVKEFDDFYKVFPDTVKDQFESSRPNGADEYAAFYPKLWKTIGDEVILCTRVLSKEHVACCVSSFLQGLEEYADKLRKAETQLDVKGNMWLASFPAPNTSILLDPEERAKHETQVSEEVEQSIDKNPHRFDFLGKAIDTGFRLAKHSAQGKCTISVQLAKALCDHRDAAGATHFSRDIRFGGTDTFKGVNDGIDYPVLTISTETRDCHKDLIKNEDELTGSRTPQHHKLKEYLASFMQVAEIEELWLPSTTGQDLNPAEAPADYRRFCGTFDQQLETLRQTDARFAESENPAAEGGARNAPLSKEDIEQIFDDEEIRD